MEELTNSINTLSINKKVVEVLNNCGIETVKDLCKCSRMDLVDKGLRNSDIKNISITLQLKGLDLKPNHAKKNVLLS